MLHRLRPRLTRSKLALTIVASIVILLPIFGGSASAAAPLGEITEFSAGLNAGSNPKGIAPGPDGNLWFTDTGTTAAIGRITPTGDDHRVQRRAQPGQRPAGDRAGSRRQPLVRRWGR